MEDNDQKKEQNLNDQNNPIQEPEKKEELPAEDLTKDNEPAVNPTEKTPGFLAADIPEQSEDINKPVENILNPKVKPQSSLPEEVLANHKIDRESYKKSLQNENSKEPPKPLSESTKGNQFQQMIQKVRNVFKNESNVVKILLIIPALIAICFVLFFLAYLANIDTAIFKIRMEGTITDSSTQTPISFAKVYINGQEKATSDETGNYQIDNLSPQVSDVKVTANGYDDFTKQIAITRGFLAYTVKQDFTLSSSQQASVEGKLIANNNKYDFSSDKIIINDKEYRINSNGTFNINDLKTGTIHFQYNSMSFKDIDTQYVLLAGTNKLQDIVLEPAGDITGVLKSYVSEDLVLGAQFNIENVSASQVKVDDKGNFVISDLDVDKKYKIRVIADGYRTRDYEIVIKQGENKLFDFRLVENFTAAFLRKVENHSQFFRSDLDGINSEQVTFIDNFNPFSWYFNNSESTLYFLSNHEHFSGAESNVRVAYSVDSSNKLTRLTTNTTNLGKVFANFSAKKLINIVTNHPGYSTSSQTLQVMDLSGENKKDIKSIDQGTFSNVLMSDDGNYIFFVEDDGDNAGFYRVNIANGDSKLISQVENVIPYDISKDGGQVVFSRKNSATGFNDLALYNFSNNETRILDENLDGFNYQFVEDNDDQILYFAKRAGEFNVYKFTISLNKDEKVTGLTSDYEILSIYQNGKYLFYYTNKGLYVLDTTTPKNFKIVTDDVVIPD